MVASMTIIVASRQLPLDRTRRRISKCKCVPFRNALSSGELLVPNSENIPLTRSAID